MNRSSLVQRSLGDPVLLLEVFKSSSKGGVDASSLGKAMLIFNMIVQNGA